MTTPTRRDRLSAPHTTDPYRETRKRAEPESCPECAAVFRDGRWRWSGSDEPPYAPGRLCPACRRTQDDYPAAVVTLTGPFVDAHEDEILGMIRNLEDRQSATHPMKRIMKIEPADGGGLVITTTETHLARTIGSHLHRAYEGELHIPDMSGEQLLRVHWHR